MAGSYMEAHFERLEKEGFTTVSEIIDWLAGDKPTVFNKKVKGTPKPRNRASYVKYAQILAKPFELRTSIDKATSLEKIDEIEKDVRTLNISNAKADLNGLLTVKRAELRLAEAAERERIETEEREKAEATEIARQEREIAKRVAEEAEVPEEEIRKEAEAPEEEIIVAEEGVEMPRTPVQREISRVTEYSSTFSDLIEEVAAERGVTVTNESEWGALSGSERGQISRGVTRRLIGR